jgi:hypothetical protein
MKQLCIATTDEEAKKSYEGSAVPNPGGMIPTWPYVSTPFQRRIGEQTSLSAEGTADSTPVWAQFSLQLF